MPLDSNGLIQMKFEEGSNSAQSIDLSRAKTIRCCCLFFDFRSLIALGQLLHPDYYILRNESDFVIVFENCFNHRCQIDTYLFFFDTQTICTRYLIYFSRWGHTHSSDERCLFLMKCSSETLQYLPFLWNTTTQVVAQPFL